MEKWKALKIVLTDKVHQYRIEGENGVLNYRDWVNNIRRSKDFILFFNDILVNGAFAAYFWEVKPVTRQRLSDDFEFVLVESRTLADIRPNWTPFQHHFDADRLTVSFPNLRGDAHLIVPGPLDETTNYAHLARFVSTAPEAQIIDFWQTAAAAYEQLIGDAPKWLSTAGLGVSWLHVRVDSRPKYYRYGAYSVWRE